MEELDVVSWSDDEVVEGEIFKRTPDFLSSRSKYLRHRESNLINLTLPETLTSKVDPLLSSPPEAFSNKVVDTSTLCSSDKAEIGGGVTRDALVVIIEPLQNTMQENTVKKKDCLKTVSEVATVSGLGADVVGIPKIVNTNARLRRKTKAFKANTRLLTLYVGNGVNANRIQSLCDFALVGRMENTRVTFEELKLWILHHWKPLLGYAPRFSTLVNGWFIFHFVTVKDRVLIAKKPWLI